MRWLLTSPIVWSASLGAWTVVGVFDVGRAWIASRTGARSPFTGDDYVQLFESLWLWAVLTPPIMAIAAKLPLERGRRLASLTAHLAIALSISFADVLIDAVLLGWIAPLPGTLFDRAVHESFINCFSYAAVAAVGYAAIYGRALTVDRARTEELQRRFLEARLEALTAKLRPHFLFNALNSVAASIRLGDRELALTAVVALGDLLRAVLTVGGDARVPLEQELEWTERYLAIERIRFQDRLQTEVRIEESAERALVPALVLQPMVENAIRHGLEKRRGAGRVTIEAERAGDVLSLVVSDTSEDATSPGARPGFGIGLESTRERLAHLYGAGCFTLELSTNATGSTAQIRIPYHESEA